MAPRHVTYRIGIMSHYVDALHVASLGMTPSAALAQDKVR